MELRTLGKTGLQVSALGFGASPLGGVFGPVEQTEADKMVHAAIDAGINFFDVAPYYGVTRAESVLGRALKGVRRERFLIATKIGRYDSALFDFSAERTVQSVEESLNRLGVETIDLIQCHDIEFVALEQIVQETIPTLRRLQAQGKVRSVGITGLPLKIFPYVLERTEVDTVLSYCHYTLFDRSLETMLPFFQSHHVGVINASPLAMGLLSNSAPPSWHPASEQIRVVCAEAARFCRSRGVEIAELAVQFALANPGIATTLVGMGNREQLERNLASVYKPLDMELLSAVQQVLAPIYNATWDSGLMENNG